MEHTPKRTTLESLTVSHQHKRQRSEAPSTFEKLLTAGGCGGWCTDSQASGEVGYEVDDGGHLQRALEQQLATDETLRKAFLQAFNQFVRQPQQLSKALHPTSAVAMDADCCGETLIRILLGVPSLQAEVARVILEIIPQQCGENADPEHPMQKRLLGQLRWLDHVVDPHQLTRQLLETLPQCSEELQQEIVTFLPEVAVEDDLQMVVDKLEVEMDQRLGLVVTALEALSNMPLTDPQQDHVLDMSLEYLRSVPVAHLPALVKILMRHCPARSAPRVMNSLRECLKFVSAADPRQDAGASEADGTSGHEKAVLAEFSAGLRYSTCLCDVFFKCISALKEPCEHQTVDLWTLLVMPGISTSRAKAVQALLKRKFAEGHATNAWLQGAMLQHEEDALLPLFPHLLELAGALLVAAAGPTVGAGCELYVLLMTAFRGDRSRQEVMRALHTHLGSSAAREASAALEVLLQLSLRQSAALAACHESLATVLGYVSKYTDSQLQTVFHVFTTLAADPGTARVVQDTLQKQLDSTIDTHLKSMDLRQQRIGMIGLVASTECIAVGAAPPAGVGAATQGRQQRAAGLLVERFELLRKSPRSFAFLCDELSRAVERGTLARPLLDQLRAFAVQEVEKFVQETKSVQETESVPDPDSAEFLKVPGCAPFASVALLGLDGHLATGKLQLMPLVCAEQAAGRDSLLCLPALLQLAIALLLETEGILEDVDGMLGCPLVLFPPELVQPATFSGLPAPQQQVLALGLFHAANWLRELLNGFSSAPKSTPPSSDDAALGNEEAAKQAKLFARLQALCQVEAMLAACLAAAGPSITLPSLAEPLLQPETRITGVQAGRAGSKGGAKKSKKKNDGEGDDEEPATAPAAAAEGCANPGRWAAEQAKFRPLRLSLLSLLGVQIEKVPPSARLSPAARLLEDLQPKLKHAFAKARPAAFQSTAKLEPGVSGVTARMAVNCLQPQLGTVRELLILAVDALVNPQELSTPQEVGECTQRAIRDAGHGDASVEPLIEGSDAAAASLEVTPAAHRVLALGLDTLQRCLAWEKLPSQAERPFLQALLSSLLQDSQRAVASGSSWDARKVVCGCLQAAKWLKDTVALGSIGSFEQQLRLVRTLQQLLALATAVSAGSACDAKRLAKLGGMVSEEAASMLASEWEGVGDTIGAGWKGRSTALAELLHMHISAAADPLALVNILSEEVLPGVEQVAGKRAHIPTNDDWPSLCAANVGIWHRVLFTELLRQWEETAAAMRRLKGSRSRANPEQARLQMTKVAQSLERTQRCAASFRHLVELTGTHSNQKQVNVQAIKFGTKFVETLIKLLPLWEPYFAANQEALTAILTEEVQIGTRKLQYVCCDGKARRHVNLTAKVPAAKKTLERYLYVLRQFFTDSNLSKALRIGTLKHRAADGKLETSQLFPEEFKTQAEERESEDEEEGGGEAGSDGGDEDEGGEDEDEELPDAEEGEYDTDGAGSEF